MTNQLIGENIIYTASVIGALLVIYKKAIIPIISFFRKLKLNYNNFCNVYDKVNELLLEFQPNHGSSMRDVVNRIEIRQLLSDERQRISLQEIGLGVFESDKNGNFIYVNKIYADMVKRTPADMMGLGWLSSVGENDRDYIKKEWINSVVDAREFSTKLSLTDSDNVEFLCQIHATPLRDAQGNFLGYFGIITKHR